MNRKDMLNIMGIIVLGLLLYMGGTMVIKSPLFGKQLPKHFIKPQTSGKEGELLPSFSILLPDSITYLNIADIPAGRPSVLFYFNPGCPFCQAEMREVIHNIDQLGGIDFYMITPYPFSDMKEFYKQFELDRFSNIKVGFDYKQFFDPYFQTTGTPFLAIYSGHRKLTATFIGVIKFDQIIDVARL